MRYSVDSEVFTRFPGFRRMVVVAENVNNTTESPALAELLRQCQQEARSPELENFKQHPALQVWAETFSAMGLNPNRFPPSVINLIKRVRGGKDLPYINSLVAVFNCISLRYLIPCGGDDCRVVTGELRLGVASGAESYVPLGQPDQVETPPVGEIIYYDTGNLDVFCRAWCWKNGDRSKLTAETRTAVINVDGMASAEQSPAAVQANVEKAAAELAALLREHTGATTRLFSITPETPEFIF